MAKYLEKKGESLEKLNCNLVSETARTTVRIQVDSWKRIVCIQVSNSVSVKRPVSNYPFDICKFGALFPLTDLQQT